MRVLRFQNPHMSGPDVSDWQAFLKAQRFLAGAVDGDFGLKTDQATRTYQSGAGLTADGVAGKKTMTQAAADGYQSTTGANVPGLDANSDCTGLASDIAAAGIQFAARYYSDIAVKAMTLAEAEALSAAGIKVVAVFQNSNNSIEKFSTAIGFRQAAKALELAASVGQPELSAIYFAVDFDPEESEVLGAIADYFKAVKAAFEAAPTTFSIGVYGSGLTCRIIRDSGFAEYTWLSQSVGFKEYDTFRPFADIVQLFPSRDLVPGLNIDDDIAQDADYGAFRLPRVREATT
jgi:hypothetical protein